MPGVGSNSRAMAPAFVLGAVAGFVSIVLGRLTAVVDRIRSLNDVSDDDRDRVHLKSDLPRLRRRAKLLRNAAHLALFSGMCVGLLLIAGFACAFRLSQAGAQIRCRPALRPGRCLADCGAIHVRSGGAHWAQ